MNVVKSNIALEVLAWTAETYEVDYCLMATLQQIGMVIWVLHIQLFWIANVYFTKGTLFPVIIQHSRLNGLMQITKELRFMQQSIGNAIDPTNPISVNISESLTGGAKAKEIVIILTGAKRKSGVAMTLHELDFVVHNCQVDKNEPDFMPPILEDKSSCFVVWLICSNKMEIVIVKVKEV